MFDQLIAKTSRTTNTKAQIKPHAAKAKTAGKTVRKAEKASTDGSQIKFAVQDFARPKAGNMLAAHTAAFLSLSGLIDGNPVPKAYASKIIGARAVQYHSNNGNFDQTEKGLTLTEKGLEFFLSRNLTVDAEHMAAFETFFTTGAINDAINVKTVGSVVAL